MASPLPDTWYQSEYVPEDAKRREFVTGFTGSAGTAVITEDAALLWTDGRYYLQAEQQLGSHWVLMRATKRETPTIPVWLATHLKPDSRVCLDPFLVSMETVRDITQTWMQREASLSLTTLPMSLVDEVWGIARPVPTCEPIDVQPLNYAGVPVSEKLLEIRKTMKENNATAVLLTAADDVAWTLNLRGHDMAYCPGVLSYLLIACQTCHLFVEAGKVTDAVQEHLSSVGVSVAPYDTIEHALREHVSQADCPSRQSEDNAGAFPPRVWIDPLQCNYALGQILSSSALEKSPSPAASTKAVKNETEIAGLVDSHVRDGVAVSLFLAWLEFAVSREIPVSEALAADQLSMFRKAQRDYLYPSFETISAFGENGAVVHYSHSTSHSTDQAPTLITRNGLYLNDSGGQYRDGTTDITRTAHLGTPTEWERTCYTAVLQGHIECGSAVFPHGTTGEQLDVLARAPIWKLGLEYEHGTGHGVGAYLNVRRLYRERVHEYGPAIHKPRTRRSAADPMVLQPGMAVTIEPGYYEAGQFGIRIENVVLVETAKRLSSKAIGPYYCFRHITVVPYQLSLINIAALTNEQLQRVNDYHATCRGLLDAELQIMVLCSRAFSRATSPSYTYPMTETSSKYAGTPDDDDDDDVQGISSGVAHPASLADIRRARAWLDRSTKPLSRGKE